MPTSSSPLVRTDLAPWLSVTNAVSAIGFYKAAFGAIETYRLEMPDGLVVKLAVDRAEFWISGGLTDRDDVNARPVGGDSVRMILTTPDPHSLFDRALKAGASQIFPVSEAHGWRVGRLVDPYGLHWEIGHLIPTEEKS